MFQNLSLFQISGKMATHATVRQRVIAENLANVDTPGYRQMDVLAFKDTLRPHKTDVTLQTTRDGHLTSRGAVQDMPPARIVRSASQGPNGNSVSLEGEIMKSAQVEQQHEMAVTVYRSTMTILRSVIARN